MAKICFFSGDITRNGGTEKVASMIANELVLQGKHEIVFLSLCEQKEVPFFEIHSSIKRFKLGKEWISPGVKYLPVIGKLRKFLRREEIDIIIDIDIILDVLSIPAAKGYRTKVISWEHFNVSYERSFYYRKKILSYSVKRSDYVVTLTEGDKENYQTILKRTDRIEAIHNPMETVSPRSIRREKQLVTVGHLVERKGYSYIAKMAPKLLAKYPDWKWILCGEGPERSMLEKVIAEHHLEGRLVLAGVVSDVGEYLSAAGIFVLTSKADGLPMCLLEAKAYGVPMVSFDIPTGPSEVIEDGVNGYLISPFDCEAMMEKLSLLMEDEKLRTSYSQACSMRTEKFEMQMIIEKWNKVLESLCE